MPHEIFEANIWNICWLCSVFMSHSRWPILFKKLLTERANLCVSFHFSVVFSLFSFVSSIIFSISISCFCFFFFGGIYVKTKRIPSFNCSVQVNILKLLLRKLKFICTLTKGLWFLLLKIQLKPSQSSESCATKITLGGLIGTEHFLKVPCHEQIQWLKF